MANHSSHAALPAIKGARYTLGIPYFDASGAPLDPQVPDTEISKDFGVFADCTEEVQTIGGSNGWGAITLTGDEMNCSLALLAAKVGIPSPPVAIPNNTLAEIRPLVLPIIDSGTAQAGAAGSITLATTAPNFDIAGCVVQTTGGTGGGGGSGSRDNQARRITAYDTVTKVASVVPDFEVTPNNTTTYKVLVTDINRVLQQLASLSDIRVSKNKALNAFVFKLVLSSDHVTPATGKTVTATRSLDGAAFAACANSVAEIGSGWYKIDLAATDTNANTVALKFTATGCDQRDIALVTQG